MKNTSPLKAPYRYIVFKRWDKLEKDDNPDVIIFFATPDVLSGLFTLSNYDCQNQTEFLRHLVQAVLRLFTTLTWKELRNVQEELLECLIHLPGLLYREMY